jgi:8-oxo-dGTP pyrophosphatase MutT (NUDIX family)
MENPEAAVAIVVAREPEESILLMRRSEREDDSWSGHWSLPGGRCDPSDADSLDTAIRELHEECGVALDRAQCGSALPHALARRKTGRYLVVAPFVFEVERALPTRLDAKEAVEAVWIAKSTILDPRRHTFRDVPRRGEDVLFPAIELGCMPLWGFTYRLLTDWLLGPLPADADLDAARGVLNFLRGRGLTVAQEFIGKLALVSGEIPVPKVLEHFRRPENFHRAINRLDVSPHGLGIAGPEFDEYWIRTVRQTR